VSLPSPTPPAQRNVATRTPARILKGLRIAKRMAASNQRLRIGLIQYDPKVITLTKLVLAHTLNYLTIQITELEANMTKIRSFLDK
jgi:hypothetical protein